MPHISQPPGSRVAQDLIENQRGRKNCEECKVEADTVIRPEDRSHR